MGTIRSYCFGGNSPLVFEGQLAVSLSDSVLFLCSAFAIDNTMLCYSTTSHSFSPLLFLENSRAILMIFFSLAA